MRNDKRLESADSIKEFKQRMALDPAYEDRHFRKVDRAYEHFQWRLKEAKITLPASVADIP